MGSKEGLKLVLNKFGSSKASAQLKVLLAIVVFSIASALLISSIYAETSVKDIGSVDDGKMILEQTDKNLPLLEKAGFSTQGISATDCGIWNESGHNCVNHPGCSWDGCSSSGSENCSNWNNDYNKCYQSECNWQNPCGGSVNCSLANSNQPSCGNYGCSWNAYCDNATCTDETSCEDIAGCNSTWNTECNGSGYSCSNWNYDSSTCTNAGCNWLADWCGGTPDCSNWNYNNNSCLDTGCDWAGTCSGSYYLSVFLSIDNPSIVLLNQLFDFNATVYCYDTYCGNVTVALDPIGGYPCNDGCVELDVNGQTFYFDSEPRERGSSLTYQAARDTCLALGADLTNFDQSYDWVNWYQEDSFDIPYYSYSDAGVCSSHPASGESTCCGMIGDGFGYHDLYGCSCHECYPSSNNIPGFGYVCAFGGKGVIPEHNGTPFYTTTSNPITQNDFACLGNMDDGDSCDINWIVMPTGEHMSDWLFYLIYSSTGYSDEQNSIGPADLSVTIMDPDVDDDNVTYNVDNCPDIYNPDQNDTDSDGLGDVCDNCPIDFNPGQDDDDGDTIGDICDACPDDANNDIDNDTICDGLSYQSPMTGAEDNCPTTPNTDQNDTDVDGIGDACDLCGMLVSNNYTLDADWICGDGDDGLIVDSSDITIDFDGHTIIGDAYGNDDTTGVDINDYDDVTILDGKVHGFTVGLYGFDTEYLTISGGDYRNNGPKDDGNSVDGYNIVLEDSTNFVIENLDASTPSHSGGGTGSGIGSCPFLYLWDGNEYNYYTDLSGESLGGAWFETNLYEAGIYELGNFGSKDGIYKLKVREVIPESDFFDEAKLVLVDVPEGYSVLNKWHNTYSDNVAPPKEFVTIKDPKTPISAVDKYRNNVLDLVSKKDGEPLGMLNHKPNSVIVDFGEIENPQYAKLIISGWSSYELNSGLPSQKNLIIERQDSNGDWQVVKSFGKFTGDLKTFVFDISGILETDNTKMRITAPSSSTTINVIDQISLDDSAPVAFKVTYLEPSQANLQSGGATNYVYPTTKHRILGAADEQLPSKEDFLMYGNFTKYGDVKQLLSSIDDMYAVMRHGDELVMEFTDVPKEANTDRHVFLLADVMYSIKYSVKGFVGDTINLLPFHGMSKYPYNTSVENYPSDAEHNAYLAEWNTRSYVKSKESTVQPLAGPATHPRSTESFYSRNSDGVEVLRNRADIMPSSILHHSKYGIFLDSSDYGLIKNVTLNGNHTTNDEYGIYLYDESDYNTIEDCTVNKWSYGIVLERSWHNMLKDNTILNNTYEGMYLRVAFNNTITGGEIGNNNQLNDYAGVYLEGSESNTISNVYMHNNKYRAIYLDNYYDGQDDWYSDDNIIESNNIDNNCGGNAGIYLYEAYDALIKNNNVTDGTGYGIYVSNSEGEQIIYNKILNNTNDGIYLYSGGENLIENNVITDNRGVGIYLEDEINDTVRNNEISSNHQEGIYAEDTDAQVYNCNFEDNDIDSKGRAYGIYDDSGPSIDWIIDTKVYCTNNDISIWGNLTFEGEGCIEDDNCEVWVKGVLFDIPACSGEETQQGGGGSSGGLPPASGQTMQIDISVIQGVTENLKVGDTVTFTVDGVSHSGTILSLSSTYVIIEFSSTPQKVTVNIGETKQVDLDGDGTFDISVFLDKVEFGKAALTFTKLAAVPPITGVATAQPTGQPAAEQPAVTEQPSVTVAAPDNTMMVILFMTLLVVAVIATIVVFAKKPKKR